MIRNRNRMCRFWTLNAEWKCVWGFEHMCHCEFVRACVRAFVRVCVPVGRSAGWFTFYHRLIVHWVPSQFETILKTCGKRQCIGWAADGRVSAWNTMVLVLGSKRRRRRQWQWRQKVFVSKKANLLLHVFRPVEHVTCECVFFLLRVFGTSAICVFAEKQDQEKAGERKTKRRKHHVFLCCIIQWVRFTTAPAHIFHFLGRITSVETLRRRRRRRRRLWMFANLKLKSASLFSMGRVEMWRHAVDVVDAHQSAKNETPSFRFILNDSQVHESVSSWCGINVELFRFIFVVVVTHVEESILFSASNDFYDKCTRHQRQRMPFFFYFVVTILQWEMPLNSHQCSFGFCAEHAHVYACITLLRRPTRHLCSRRL